MSGSNGRAGSKNSLFRGEQTRTRLNVKSTPALCELCNCRREGGVQLARRRTTLG